MDEEHERQMPLGTRYISTLTLSWSIWKHVDLDSFFFPLYRTASIGWWLKGSERTVTVQKQDPAFVFCQDGKEKGLDWSRTMNGRVYIR